MSSLSSWLVQPADVSSQLHAASALASTNVPRYIFGYAFPLFTDKSILLSCFDLLNLALLN